MAKISVVDEVTGGIAATPTKKKIPHADNRRMGIFL
jgi:hypothetical protein